MASWFRGRGASATPPQAAPGGGSGRGGQGVPLELIKYDAQSGKFELGEEALAVLRQTRGPVGVVAVCGRARQVSQQAGAQAAASARRRHCRHRRDCNRRAGLAACEPLDACPPDQPPSLPASPPERRASRSS